MNFRILLIVLITALLTISITLTAIFVPRYLNKDKEEKADEQAPEQQVLPEELPDQAELVTAKPIYKLRKDRELAPDLRDPNYNKIQHGKVVLPFTVPVFEQLKAKSYNLENFTAQELDNPAGGNEAGKLLVFGVANENQNIMGVITLGNKQVNTIPQSTKRTVGFKQEQVGGYWYLYTFDYLPGEDLAYYKFKYNGRDWDLVLNE